MRKGPKTARTIRDAGANHEVNGLGTCLFRDESESVTPAFTQTTGLKGLQATACTATGHAIRSPMCEFAHRDVVL